MKFILIAYLTVAASVTVLADEVQLTSGRTLVGIAHDEEDRWMVETRHGDLRVPKSDVRAVVPGRTAMHEYQERFRKVDGGRPTAEEVVALALWAQEQGLIRYVNPLLNRAIQIDPEHRQARQLLGFVQQDGVWMTATARDTLLRERERAQREADRKPPEPVRRRIAPPEETPYSLGLPLTPDRSMTDVYPPRSGSYSGGYSTGGYVLSIGGVTPAGDVVISPGLRPFRIR